MSLTELKRMIHAIVRALPCALTMAIALPAVADQLSDWADMNARARERYENGESDAAALAENALNHAARHFGRDTEQYATSALLLCIVESENGRPDVAEPLCSDAVAIRERVLGADLATADALSVLASVHRDQGRFGDAQVVLERELAIWRQQDASQHEGLAVTLNRLGMVSYRQGNETAAESYYLEALAVKERAGTLTDEDAAFVLGNLGTLYLDQERASEAIRYLVQAVATTDKLGDRGPDLARLLTDLGLAYVRSGRAPDAVPPARRVVDIYTELDGAEAQSTVEMRLSLLKLLMSLKQYAEARDEYAELLRVFRKTTGTESVSTATIELGLGVVHYALQDLERAEPLVQHALKVFEANPEVSPAGLEEALRALANIYAATGRDDQVDLLRQRADALTP
jgi:tetratricopeptide (TPR) repeat protein